MGYQAETLFNKERELQTLSFLHWKGPIMNEDADVPQKTTCNEKEAQPQNRVELEKEGPAIVVPKLHLGEVVFGNIEDSLAELKDYYKINKEQARSSFIVSVISLFSGLLVLVLGTHFLGPSKLTILSSALPNVFGGAYLYLYKESMSRLSDFHNKLLAIQKIMLAVTLVDKIEDARERDQMIKHLITQLIKHKDG